MASIYALYSSLSSDEIRYVGKTVRTLEKRLFFHMIRHEREANRHKSHWINKVIAEGGEVCIRLLETCDDFDQDAREIHWIAECRKLGHKLTNMSDGGEGGFNPCQEVRDKISKAHKGRKYTEQALENIRAGARRKDISGAKNPRYGAVVSEETRNKIAAKATGVIKSMESVAKHRATMVASGKNRGENSGQSKLTEDKVVSLYKRVMLGGENYKDVSFEYGIHPMHWYRIKNGTRWGHLNLRERFGV